MKVSEAEIDKLVIENGKAKDADAIKEAVKKEWSDFVTTQEVQGTGAGKPLAGSTVGTDGVSKASQRALEYQRSHYGAVPTKEG